MTDATRNRWMPVTHGLYYLLFPPISQSGTYFSLICQRNRVVLKIHADDTRETEFERDEISRAGILSRRRQLLYETSVSSTILHAHSPWKTLQQPNFKTVAFLGIVGSLSLSLREKERKRERGTRACASRHARRAS